MTYCIGMMLDNGIIFASDSRTNAGMDNFAKFCKMTLFSRAGDRVIVLLSSGNLAGTQAVIGVLNQRCAVGDAAASLWRARTMFDVAKHFPEKAYYSPNLIDRVAIAPDGTGTMLLKAEGLVEKKPMALYSSDFGKTWTLKPTTP